MSTYLLCGLLIFHCTIFSSKAWAQSATELSDLANSLPVKSIPEIDKRLKARDPNSTVVIVNGRALVSSGTVKDNRTGEASFGGNFLVKDCIYVASPISDAEGTPLTFKTSSCGTDAKAPAQYICEGLARCVGAATQIQVYFNVKCVVSSPAGCLDANSCVKSSYFDSIEGQADAENSQYYQRGVPAKATK